MTAEEMLYRAEVGYDFITGFSAASISKKEWSLFFTTAQMDVVKKRLPVSDKDVSFEEVELIAEQFSELITDAIDSSGSSTTVPSIYQLGGADRRSVFYDIPDDFLYGILEKVEFVESDCNSVIEDVLTTTGIAELAAFCGNTTDTSIWTPEETQLFIDANASCVVSYSITDNIYSYYIEEDVNQRYRIKPVNHNYYVANKDNPFKQPGLNSTWRLKAKKYSGKNRHELIPFKKIKNYYLRYLMVPTPIIVFDEDYENDIDQIQGVVLDDVFTNGVSLNPILSDTVCDTIVNRAIMIAQKSLSDVEGYQLGTADNSNLN